MRVVRRDEAHRLRKHGRKPRPAVPKAACMRSTCTEGHMLATLRLDRKHSNAAEMTQSPVGLGREWTMCACFSARDV